MNKKTVIVLLSIAGALIVALSSVVAVMLINSHKEAEAAIASSEQEEKNDKTLKKGLEYYENEKYEDAINFFSKISKNNAAYEKAQEMLEKSKNAYRNDMLTKADEYFQNEEHEVAMNLLKNALKVLPEDSAFEAKYDTINASFKTKIRTEAVATAKEYADKNDFESALFFVKEANEKIGNNDEELSALATSYSNKYREQLFASAETKAASNDFDGAITILYEGLTVLANDSEINSKITYYEGRKPVPVADLDYFYHQGGTASFRTETEMTDNLGNLQTNISTTSGDNVWNTYKLDAKYKKITGTLFLAYAYRSNTEGPELRIYCDGVLKADYSVNRGDEPVKFEIDLTGVKELVISFDADTASYGGWGSGYSKGGISNFYIWKQ